MTTRACMVLAPALLAMACGGSPSAPSPMSPAGPPPGVRITTVEWQGTLTREGQTAEVSVSATELSSPNTATILYGPYQARFPWATYTGGASGATDGQGWAVSLTPTSGTPCGGPFALIPGSINLQLSPAGDQLTGGATVHTCEDSTRWQASFRRR